MITSISSLSHSIVQSPSHAQRYRAPGMLSTSERSSASLARSRAARSPVATRTASTSGSNGMRITSSAPESSASRSSCAEPRSAHTTTCTPARSGRSRTAEIKGGPCRASVTTICAAPSATAPTAAAVSVARSRRSPEAASTAHASSPSCSSPSSSTPSPSRTSPSSALDGRPRTAVLRALPWQEHRTPARRAEVQRARTRRRFVAPGTITLTRYRPLRRSLARVR